MGFASTSESYAPELRVVVGHAASHRHPDELSAFVPMHMANMSRRPVPLLAPPAGPIYDDSDGPGGADGLVQRNRRDKLDGK